MATKVYCACIECKHNKKNVCKAKEIYIRSWIINTTHYGKRKMEECITFEKSVDFEKIEKFLKNWSDSK